MTKIIRTEVVTREVTVPDGYVVCRFCGGKGRPTKYDQGWHSIINDPSLDAPQRCPVCLGDGFVPEDHYDS